MKNKKEQQQVQDVETATNMPKTQNAPASNVTEATAVSTTLPPVVDVAVYVTASAVVLVTAKATTPVESETPEAVPIVEEPPFCAKVTVLPTTALPL
jgi:hypothetical protein